MKSRRKQILALFSALAVVLTVVSCATVDRAVMAPPQIPGATFAGSESCEQCHADKTKHFATSDHARMRAKGENAANVGCESCHGPASIHISSGGASHTIVNPRKSPETCFQCHLDKRGSFSLPHHHPVMEGRMSCGDCHNPHEGRVVKGGGTSLASANETCFKCHSAQRGPFVFEHEAMREGCVTCHAPHGSVNQRMLTERNQLLCLKCHFQQQFAGNLLIANDNHNSNVARGTCYSAGCHEAIHGSQVQRRFLY